MSCDMLASVWSKYLNLVHQTVSRACRYGLGTRLAYIRMPVCCGCGHTEMVVPRAGIGAHAHAHGIGISHDVACLRNARNAH